MIHGSVVAEVMVEPQVLVFGKIWTGKQQTRQVKLVFEPVGDEEIGVEGIEVQKGFFTAELIEQTRDGALIEVTSASDFPMRKIQDTIIVKTSSEKSSEVRIRVLATGIGNIDVSPPTLVFGAAAGGPSRRRLTLTKVDGRADLRIEKVESDSGLVATELIEVEAGKRYEIEATYTPDPERGTLTGNLTIFTNDSRRNRIEVPIRAEPGRGRDLGKRLQRPR